MADPDVDVEDWLEQWVEENLQDPGYREHKSAMSGDADMCRADAEEAGISEADLEKAAGGDLEAFLLRAQNALTYAEVGRKVEEDDS
jgi:hypothetical protein